MDSLTEAEKRFIEDLTFKGKVIAQDYMVKVDFKPDLVANCRITARENKPNIKSILSAI